MPPLSPDVFWAAVTASRLLPADQVPQIRAACDAATAAAADAPDKQTALAAQWLVQQRLLTLWQAKRLARGGGGPFFVGDYRLLDQIESPATGVVFRARHDPSKRAVALVPLDRAACQRVEIWTEVVRRTERAAATTDPVLSRTWAIEDAPAGRFVICEDLPGQSLASELADRGRWPVEQAVTAVLAVCRGVAELHRLGGVHGALSLATIVRPAASGEAAPSLRLLQYPLSGDPLGLLAADPLQTPQAVARLGEQICFVPPERLANGVPVSPAGDVYGLGCLLHALLAGGLTAWQGDAARTAARLRQAAAAGTPLLPPLAGCPEEVSRLVAYLTAFDPARRYADAAEAADAIAACLGVASPSSTLPAPQPVQENLIAVAAGTTAGAASASTPAAPRAKGSGLMRSLAIGGGVAALVTVVGLGLAVWRAGRSSEVPGADGPGQSPASPAEGAVAGAATTPQEASQPASDTGRFVVDEDETLPWLPPTAGPPPTFRYLPRGSQLILEARPAEVLATADGKLIVQAGDTRLARAIASLEALLEAPLATVDRLQISWQAAADGQPLTAIWARLGPPQTNAGSAPGGSEPPVTSESSPEAATAAGVQAETVGNWVRWRPAEADGREVVVASAALQEELVAAGSAEAALPRSLRPLVPVLDRDRQFTLFGSPHYFVHDGRRLLPPAMQPLLDPLEQLLGADCPAAAVSFHLDDRTYLELAALGPPVGSARELERRLREELAAMPDEVESVVSNRTWSPYGRRLVLRLPQVLRLASANVKVGRDRRDLVMANTYLPQLAGHNLGLAATLVLEQIAADPQGKSVSDGQPAAPVLTVAERLRQPVTIVFASDTLETAVAMLAEESGIPVTIAGADLELAGITKNQSFGLNERDVPVEEILLTILRKSDNNTGKLVYVRRGDGPAEELVITTRKAAEQRGETIPEVFGPAEQP